MPSPASSSSTKRRVPQMFARACVCARAHARTYTCARGQTFAHAHVRAHRCNGGAVRMCTHARSYLHRRTCVHARAYVHPCARARTRPCAGGSGATCGGGAPARDMRAKCGAAEADWGTQGTGTACNPEDTGKSGQGHYRCQPPNSCPGEHTSARRDARKVGGAKDRAGRGCSGVISNCWTCQSGECSYG